ncbi:fdhC [Symbiodinium natans]|uniref:FdhC protein n=1 Tax=Symbiodinium natans TaxID=878477 RepID=A0A812K866_9DINO|nr:fdhC [Symbiodinium natans]
MALVQPVQFGKPASTASQGRSQLLASPKPRAPPRQSNGFARMQQSLVAACLATSLYRGKSTRVFKRSVRHEFASTPQETYETFVAKAEHLVKMSPLQSLYASVLGAAFVAVASASALSFSEAVGPNLLLDKLVFAVVLPVHLLLCQLCGGQLTTSNCSMLSIGVLQGKVSIKDAVRNVGIVLAGNAIGVGLILGTVWYLQVLDQSSLAVAALMAKSKCAYTFGQTFVKAFLCNWMVFVAYWLGVMSKDIKGKMTGIWTGVFLYAAVGFEHIVTNMFLLPAALMAGTHLTLADMLVKNIIPVLLGNAAASIMVAGGSFGFAFGQLLKKLKVQPLKMLNAQVHAPAVRWMSPSGAPMPAMLATP